MPTSVNVTNLKINELTETQYDSAVQGGVIGANEISFLTDVDESIQVSTMPTASATELDKIYQYIGATDANYTHGYFYECVSDGATPPVYSWSNVQVQASSGGLPSQTGNSGKFLTTDGTDASWSDKPLVNTATGTDSLTILGTATVYSYSMNVGKNSSAKAEGVAVGESAAASGNQGCVAVGRSAIASGYTSLAIGNRVTASAQSAIQLGGFNKTNSDANTFKIGNDNGNFEIMSADGTIPTARLTKVNTTATLTAAGWSNSSQTITVNGMTATGVVLVSPDPSNQSAYTSAGIICTAQATDSLTFTCTSTPSADLTVNVVML